MADKTKIETTLSIYQQPYRKQQKNKKSINN